MQTSPIPIGDHRKQVRYQQIQRADRARNPKLRKRADKGAFPRGTGARERLPRGRRKARQARVVPFDPNASALVIETAITDNAQPFNQPWPPTGLGDGWHASVQSSRRPCSNSSSHRPRQQRCGTVSKLSSATNLPT
jgi:hypothetical protein